MEHWTERHAHGVRRELGIRGYAGHEAIERLLEAVRSGGVEIREEKDCECLGSLLALKTRSRIKILAGMPGPLRLQVLLHEVAHLFTRSGMSALCSEEFAWWWTARDERSAHLWSCHFLLPSAPVTALIRKGARWPDLLGETGAPPGLLALKLRTLGVETGVPAPPSGLFLSPSLSMAVEVWKLFYGFENAWQRRLGMIHRTSGERWVYRRAQHLENLFPYEEELAWDLVGWSAERFWKQWQDRLEPVGKLFTPGERSYCRHRRGSR